MILESQSGLSASNHCVLVILEEESTAGKAYPDAIGQFLAKDISRRYMAPEKRGLFSRLFRGAALYQWH